MRRTAARSELGPARTTSDSIMCRSQCCPKRVFGLIDETAPGTAFLVAQRDAKAVRQAAYSTTVAIAEGIAVTSIGSAVRGTAPCLSVFVAKRNEVSVSKTVHAHLGCFFLKAEESARHAAVYAIPFVDHSIHYSDLRASFT